MFSRLRHWSQHLLARAPALMPTSCALCGASGDMPVCAGCHDQFFSLRPQRCTQCAIALPQMAADTATLCGDCLKQPPAFDATIVAADYAPPIDQLVLGLKFGKQLALAPLFARMLCDALLRQQDNADTLPSLLTAVPLGAQRLAERGYNQALEIAKPLSRATGIRLEPRIAVRVRDTCAQAMLHPDERQKNIRRAFVVSPHAMEQVRGKHVGVVDDVITTGETLSELASTLKRFGATRVTNFVFARTAPK